MLLLVALCLSLMGGSAYALAPLGGEGELMSLEPMDELPTASDPNAVGSIDSGSTNMMTLAPLDGLDTYTSDVELNSLEVMPLTAEGNIWNGRFPNLETAAQNITSIQLHKDFAEDTVQDAGGTINRAVTIDLNGKNLQLTGPLVVNANITIKNGGNLTGANMITVSQGNKVTFQGVKPDGPVSGDGSSDEAEAYVATIGSNKFATVVEAFEHAAKQSGTVTINFVNDTSELKNLTIGTLPTTMSCSNLVLNLNANCLEGTLPTYCPMTINGGEIQGTVEATNNVTLNNTKVTNVRAVGKTVTVNNSTVSTNLALEGATLTMGSGSTVGKIIIDDTNGGQSTLDVRGGDVNGLTVSQGIAKRAVTGGKWAIGDDPDTVSYLNAAVAQGMTLNGTKSPYTVGKGSGTVVNPGVGGNTGSDGNFTYTVYGSPYTKNSNGSVYIDISALSDNGYYWIGTSANDTSVARQLGGEDYSLVSNGSGYRLTLSNSYLNRLAAGTYYGFVTYNGATRRMGSFAVTNSGTIYPSGDVAVWPVNEYTWYSGDPLLAFYYKPAINEKGIMIDGWTVPGIDWVDNHMGTLKLGSNILNNLSRGWHTLTINTDSGIASCDFFIGATLKPVDTDKHVLGSSKNLQFVCTDPISRVWVGPNELTNSYYGDYFSLSSSGKTITLSSKFLNDRAAGTYTLTVQTSNGDQPSCTFQILTRAQASSSPRTGDDSNLGLWAAVLLVSGAAGVALLPRLRKNEH